MYLRAVSQAPYTIHAAKSVEHVVPMRLRYKLKTIWQISPIVSPGVNKFRFTRVGVGLGYVEYVDLDGALCSHACVKKEGRKKEREERDVGRLRWKIFCRVVDRIVFVSRSIEPHVRFYSRLFLDAATLIVDQGNFAFFHA